jgi:Leucine-rich repeat (LRR) protein
MKNKVNYLIIIMTLFSSSLMFSAIPATERAALIAFYNATGGDNWTNNSGWKEGTLEPDGFGPIGSEGTWSGVFVSNEHVERLGFVRNNLIGFLPSQIGDLTYLEFLALNTNKISGHIPPEIEKLSKLVSLGLEFNELSGSIPNGLGNIQTLITVDLHHNQLSGNIPTEFQNLIYLYFLDLSSNRLSGSIPNELGNILNLSFLNLSNNQLSGNIPKELGKLEQLNSLFLNSNQLSGNIPPELGNLSMIDNLVLSDNQLTGNIPSSLSNNWILSILDLSSNLLSGNIPNVVTEFEYLHELNLSSNQFNGTIPVELGKMNFLWVLDLSENQLHGEIPLGLGQIPSLRILDLSENNLSGIIPKDFGDLLEIKTLNLASNQLSGQIPDELCKLTNFFHLNLASNRLSGNIPEYFGDAVFIDYINLSSNMLTGRIPKVFLEKRYLEFTDIGYNSLYTDDLTIISLLNEKDPNWEETQTYAPSNISASALSGTSVKASWSPVTYTIDPGGYTVYYSTWANGPWIKGGTVFNKNRKYYQITGLSPGTHYYFAVKTFTRPHINNINTVFSEFSLRASATTYFEAPQIPEISLSRNRLNFGCIENHSTPSSQYISISNSGEGVLNWSASSESAWIIVNPNSSSGSGIMAVSVDASALSEGQYTGNINVFAPNATNSPQIISLTITVYQAGNDADPFGSYDTPVDGSTISGSVPFTGWALDDLGVNNVKLYCQLGSELLFIGDALFVEGARPDIEIAYPGYPQSYQAGWGYMMLSNFLPNNGNGTFTILAIATDNEGHQVTLGSKTIHCDNANAVKPFGAIDTPTQGGTASGSNFINWGWALTPQPNKIPIDGSTIDVYVDGFKLGNPAYNEYRSDIAALFPGYANSNGAVGYFYLDTTELENGVHTMQWVVKDNANNTDGIGSRYFTVQNNNYQKSTTRHVSQKQRVALNHPIFSTLQLNKILSKHPNTELLMVQKGFDLLGNLSEPVLAGKGAEFLIKLKELERIKISAPKSKIIAAYMHVNKRFDSLPISSRLDSDSGVFYWQPGAAFIGDYPLILLVKKAEGTIEFKKVLVRIEPKFTK